MAQKDLCAQALAIGKYVVGAFFVQGGNLTRWQMRKGLQLPEPEKVSAMMFQRTLIHSMLKMREEYTSARCTLSCQATTRWTFSISALTATTSPRS